MKSFNAVILGGGGTGKSSLTLRFMKEMFVDSYDPTIEESYRKQVKVDGELCNIEVLDTAGADQFTAVNEYYIRGSAGFILVFSLTQASSMRQVEALRQQIFRVKGLPIPNSISLDDFPLDGERTPSNGSSGHATPNGGHRSSSRRHQGGPRAKPSRSPLNIDSLSNARASDERSRSSGEDPNALMQDRYHHIPANREASTIPLVIVGTKSDLMGDREVSREMAIRCVFPHVVMWL
ncbi:ras-domain-containing protein [Clavulina sp. PMI_390]|nr:ras-domain-containing protein [Clavulina sp. PMI_390]